MKEKITPQNFYSLFLREVEKSNIQLIPWNENKKWTRKMLKGKDCIMKNIADKLGLHYCNEYFMLDGIFFRKELKYKSYKGFGYAQNIEIILECENEHTTIEKEIYKLFPLFFAPLKVIITYFSNNSVRHQKAAEKIKGAIENKIKTDDPFGLHKNKIKTLLIFGIKNKGEINWQAFVYFNGKFRPLT